MTYTKSLMATAATALVLATSAFADGHTSAFTTLEFDSAVNLNASELIGMRVYASESDISGEIIAADGEREWDDIGEINEIVLTRAGEVASVIVGVGGFLSIGEKNVAIDMSQLQIVSEEGDSDDYFLVVKANVAGVEEAPSYEASRDNMDDADTNERETMLAAPAVEREGYEAVEVDQLTTEMLTGARVYGSTDEDVGEVGELLLTSDGKIDKAIIDVGGFIGIGEKPVAVSMNELTILQADGDVRVYIDSTQDALEQLPAYEG